VSAFVYEYGGYGYSFEPRMDARAVSWSEAMHRDQRTQGVDWLPDARRLGAKLADEFEQVWARAIDELQAAWPKRFDADDEREKLIDQVLNGLEMEWSTVDFGRFIDGVFKAVTSKIDENIKDDTQKALGIDPQYENQDVVEGLLDRRSKTTINKMKGVGEAAKAEMSSLVREGFDKGWATETLGDKIQERVGIGRRRAQFVARNEMGNLYAEHTQARQDDIGVTHYIWRTSLDERVRASHSAKEGERFSWRQPPADTGHPGEDYNCRCTAEADLESIALPDEEQPPAEQPDEPRETDPVPSKRTIEPTGYPFDEAPDVVATFQPGTVISDFTGSRQTGEANKPILKGDWLNQTTKDKSWVKWEMYRGKELRQVFVKALNTTPFRNVHVGDVAMKDPLQSLKIKIPGRPDVFEMEYHPLYDGLTRGEVSVITGEEIGEGLDPDGPYQPDPRDWVEEVIKQELDVELSDATLVADKDTTWWDLARRGRKEDVKKFLADRWRAQQRAQLNLQTADNQLDSIRQGLRGKPLEKLDPDKGFFRDNDQASQFVKARRQAELEKFPWLDKIARGEKLEGVEGLGGESMDKIVDQLDDLEGELDRLDDLRFSQEILPDRRKEVVEKFKELTQQRDELKARIEEPYDEATREKFSEFLDDLAGDVERPEGFDFEFGGFEKRGPFGVNEWNPDDSWAGAKKEKAKKVMSRLNRFFGDVRPEDMPPIRLTQKGGGAYSTQSNGGYINIGSDKGRNESFEAVLMHEYMHQMEDANPALGEGAARYLLSQAEKRGTTKVSKVYGGGDGFVGTFRQSYATKIYSNPHTSSSDKIRPGTQASELSYEDLTGTEVSTMAVQEFVTDERAMKLLRDDPNLFWWAVSLSRGDFR